MLSVRRGFGDEKTQLNELNKRLDQYLSKVRQLESENQVLVEEIHRLRQERGAEWTKVYFNELCLLRRQVEELSIQKCEVELQKDNLWQEFQDLQELWEQVRSMRLKIDQQLELYKKDLQQAKTNQASLEELYFRLQQERQILQTSQEEEMFALRDKALQMPLQITMQDVARHGLSLRDVQSLSMELSESWKEAFLVYQKKIEELENTLRLEEEGRLGMEEEVRGQKLQIEELRKEYEELLGIEKILEKELLRMKEKYSMETEEYQIIIEELENQKRNITLTITERLKDYHDLMQVKTGLSLEVAAYRALLEAENKKGGVIWTEHSVRERPAGGVIWTEHSFRERPAGFVTSSFEESTKYSQRATEYPIRRHKEEKRRNIDTTNIDRFVTRTVPQKQIRSKYSNLGNTSSSYVSHAYENATHDKSGRWEIGFPSRYDMSNKAAFPQTLHQPVHLTNQPVITPFLLTQSTLTSETKKEEKVKDLKPVARPRTHSKEAKKVDAHVGTEGRKQDSVSQRTLESKVIEEHKVTSKPIEQIQQTLECNLEYSKKTNTISEAASEAEPLRKEMIQEGKQQELPIKKERKKREQAKKRKDLENVEIGDVNVVGGSNFDIHENTRVIKTVVLGEKESAESDHPVILEIPIQLGARRTEISTQEKYMGENAQGNASHKDVDDRNTFIGKQDRLSSIEKKQEDIGLRTTIFGKSMQGEQVVLNIPIHCEERKREDRSEIENVEHSRLPGNSNQTNVIEDTTFLKNEEVIKAQEIYEGAENLSEHSGKKAIVTDILRQLGQPTALDDSNVTYMEKEEQCGDGFVKTQIFVQSKTTEEMDLFDEPDLTDLWNTTTVQSPTKSMPGSIGSLPGEIESRTTKKTILKDVSGAQAEEWIGNVIHSGLKTGTGKSINVEIVEESFGTIEYDKGEFPTPFHVEEAEDNYNMKESVTSEQHTPISTESLQDETALREDPSQVEEITEGEHVDEETDYFVYVPDDNPCLEEMEEEETLRGQIHTEEESHLKYSWQDEFLQGSQGRKSLSELLKNAMATEQSSASKDTSDGEEKRLINEDKEQSHFESIIIEKKIEVPQEMKTSIIKFLSKDVKDPQEKLKGTLDCLQGKLPQDLVDELSALAGEDLTQSSSLAVDIKKVGQTEESGMVTIVAEINVSQTVDADDLDMLELAKESEVTTIHASNLKSSDDLPSFFHKQNENLTFSKESDKDEELRHSMGANSGEEHYTEEISVKGPATTTIRFSPTRELSIGQISPDASKFIKHIELGNYEQISYEDTRSELGSAGELSPTEINRSEHHIKIGPREILSKKQIIFEGPVSETLKLENVNNTEDSSDQNRSIRHIKISPAESFQAEQIIFHGPIFKTVGIGQNVTGGLTSRDDSAESVSHAYETLLIEENQSDDKEKIIQVDDYVAGASKSVSHFKINSGEMSKEIVLEKSIPRPNVDDYVAGASKSVSHFKINSGEMSKEIVLEKSIPRPNELSITLDANDDSTPIEYNFATQKVHVAKQTKHQGYVSDAQSDFQSNDRSSINTSVHHIKLSPSREQIVFEGRLSPNFQIREDGSHSKGKSIPIRHIQLGSPDSHISEYMTFEVPTKESHELSEYIVSSPSGDSTESERSIKHIKLGPTEKSFTFQMDITKIATKHTGQDGAQETSMVITEGQQYSELKDDSDVAESGYSEEEIAGVSQLPYSIPSHQVIGDTSEVDRTVQLQRIVHQGHMVSDDKKVAVVYLDDEEEDEEEEETDQDYLQRSF
ncbi:synemin [Dendrobates tinctorius]|uniref:synemin n=1 Tax=Dendrobates tinctorius TaxID=92724 RepID=UPI003CCA5131